MPYCSTTRFLPGDGFEAPTDLLHIDTMAFEDGLVGYPIALPMDAVFALAWRVKAINSAISIRYHVDGDPSLQGGVDIFATSTKMIDPNAVEIQQTDPSAINPSWRQFLGTSFFTDGITTTHDIATARLSFPNSCSDVRRLPTVFAPDTDSSIWMPLLACTVSVGDGGSAFLTSLTSNGANPSYPTREFVVSLNGFGLIGGPLYLSNTVAGGVIVDGADVGFTPSAYWSYDNNWSASNGAMIRSPFSSQR